MSINISLSRQRVPMVDASTLEDRTRPVLDGSVGSRLRYFSWPSSLSATDRAPSHQPMPTRARMGRR